MRHRPSLPLAALLAASLGLIGPAAAEALLCPAGDFPPFYEDAAPFEAALAQTAGISPWPQRVTGLTVPHHLVVPELIAGGYRLALGKSPKRILLLMPDHFRALDAPFGTSAKGYQSLLGNVPGDLAALTLVQPGFIEESCLFGTDHAIRAHLPFLARLFPEVPVLPIAIGLSTSADDWDQLAERLAPLLSDDTLIVQSTDFSHYLPAWQARQRDQEVLNLLSAGDPEQLKLLRQPDHVDSVGANWLHNVLQHRQYGASPIVVANRNQQDLRAEPLAETTSYMVILYSPDTAPAAEWPFLGTRLYMLGGDFFLGRVWPRLLFDELATQRVETAALSATAGLPLIVNLEGALLPEPPATLPHLTLAAPSALALDWAKRLNVIGLGLANNHSLDLGLSGAAETEDALREAGIPFARQAEPLTLDGVTLVALSDFDGGRGTGRSQLTPALLDQLILPDPAVPVVAYVHWGAEWQNRASAHELDLAQQMARRGVAAVIGMHPHVASERPIALNGGATLLVHSLGNFLFDQRSPPASGALVELRSFAQGTIFLRQLPLPALFNIAAGN